MTALPLSELSELISDSLATSLEPTYWVQGEVANMSVRGGHCYLDLVEKTEDGALRAKARAVCWNHLYTMISAYFETETGIALQVGIQVLVEVEVTYHAVYGLSLNIVNIDPSYTLGNIARQRQQTIARLQQEGIFELQKELSLPSVIQHIAVISSDQAAGYEDFIHQLQSSPYRFETQLFPAYMQGESAVPSIIEALQAIYHSPDTFDAVVMIRGGGASVDLACFDDYNLCSHCAQFPLPIISGIGHTRDVSITDMVVHLALKTPTAVASFLVDGCIHIQERIDQLRVRLAQTSDRQIMLRQHRIDLLRQSLELLSPARLYEKGYSLMTIDGHVVRSIHDVNKGSIVTTHLSDGSVTSIVQ